MRALVVFSIRRDEVSHVSSLSRDDARLIDPIASILDECLSKLLSEAQSTCESYLARPDAHRLLFSLEHLLDKIGTGSKQIYGE